MMPYPTRVRYLFGFDLVAAAKPPSPPPPQPRTTISIPSQRYDGDQCIDHVISNSKTVCYYLNHTQSSRKREKPILTVQEPQHFDCPREVRSL